jgi:O-antigen/teichoic acid export membrane protein
LIPEDADQGDINRTTAHMNAPVQAKSRNVLESVRAQAEKVWVGADQIASSATNFAASALTAGLLTAAGFGAVSLAFGVYIVVAGASRAWTAEPLLLVASNTEPRERDRLISSALGASLSIGAVAGAVTALVGFLVGGTVGAALVALGIGFPGLLTHDTSRFALVMQQRARRAFESDVIWMIFSVVTLMYLRVTNLDSVGLATAGWTLGATFAAFWAVRGTVTRPTRHTRSWLVRILPIAPMLTAEVAIVQVSSSVLLIFVTALTANLTQTGAFRGALVLLGPAAMCVAATSLYLRPIMVRFHQQGRSTLRKAAQESGFNAVFCGVWLAVVMLIPNEIGIRIFGATWEPARELVPIVSLSFLGLGLMSGPLDALRSSGALKALVRVRALIAVTVLISMVVGARLLDTRGAITGYSVGSALGALVSWFAALRSDELRSAQYRSGLRPLAKE